VPTFSKAPRGIMLEIRRDKPVGLAREVLLEVIAAAGLTFVPKT